MIPYERQQKILGLLKNKELLKFEEIQQNFPTVSDSTLRRDLKELKKNNKVEYLSGGAIKLATTIGEVSITTKKKFHSKEKEHIATVASKHVDEGDVIYLDSGTTCTSLFNKIKEKEITIYTSNAEIFSDITNLKANVIFLGGEFNPLTFSVSGSLAEKNIQELYFSKSFLGANGIDEKYGVTTPTLSEANKKRLVREHSDEVFLLSDSSKFHNLSHVRAFLLKDVTIISDKFDEKLGEIVSIIFE